MGSSVSQIRGVTQRSWKTPSHPAVLCSRNRQQGVCSWNLAMKPAVGTYLCLLLSSCCLICTFCTEQLQRCAFFLVFSPLLKNSCGGERRSVTAEPVYFRKFQFQIVKNVLVLFFAIFKGMCGRMLETVYNQTTLLVCIWDIYVTEFRSNIV